MKKTLLSSVVALVALLALSSTASADESAAANARAVPPLPDAVAFSQPVPDDPAPASPSSAVPVATQPAPAAPAASATPDAPSADSVTRLYNEYRSSSGASSRSSSSPSSGPRVSIGLRFLNHWLLSPKKGQPFHHSFIGSINRLDIHNSFLPSPYLRFSAPVGPIAAGLEFSYTRYHISTRDNGGGDGAIDTDALFLVALAEIPNPSPLTPYVQAGAACALNDFDPIGSWSGNNRREFDLDDSVGFVGAIGCAWAIADCLDLDLYVRYMDYDVDGKYIYRGDSRPDTPFTFTTENISAGLGLCYVF